VLVVHDGRFPESVREPPGGGAAVAERLGWISGAICMSDAIRNALAEFVPDVPTARLTPLLTTPGTDLDLSRVDGGTDLNLSRVPELPERVEAFFRRHEVVVVTGGALAEHYGLGDVLDAFDILLSQGRKIGLVLLLGSFAREEALARRLREAVERWGDDVILPLTDFGAGSDVIARGRVYVRPSRVDSFGLGLYEAIEAGVPVVAARHETRPDGVLIYEPGDVAGLLSALEKALTAESRSNARSRAPEVRASIERNRADTLRFLESLV
jgi:glycosyltransferase involved in cell wall biosynthesis